MIGLTCDGWQVVYAVSEDDDRQTGPPIYTLYRCHLQTRTRHKILSAGFRISHVLCSPTDPDFIRT